MFILYTSEFFHIIGNYIVSYTDDTTIYAVIHRPLSRPQAMELLNQDLAEINSCCLKWHMRLNSKKTISIVVSRSRIVAPGYGDLSLSCAVLQEVKSLRILRVTLDYTLTFNTHLQEIVSKAARSLGVVRRTG